MSSQIEDRLKKIDSGGKDSTTVNPEVKSELERELEQEEALLAQELRDGRAKEVIVRRQLHIKELKDTLKETGNELPPGSGKHWTLVDGKPVPDPDGEYDTFIQAYKVAALDATNRNKQKWSVIDGKPVPDPDGVYETFAQALQVASVENSQNNVKHYSVVDGKPIPDPEGEYDSFAEAYKVAALEVAKATKKTGSPDEVSELRKLIDNLKDEIRKGNDPIEIGKKWKSYLEELKASGVVLGSAGESIEVVREQNRHDEKIAEMQISKKHNDELAQILGDGVEKLGEGLGQMAQGSSGRQEKTTDTALPEEQIQCTDCGTLLTAKAGQRVIHCTGTKKNDKDEMVPCNAVYRR